jgi:hypothetical protein
MKRSKFTEEQIAPELHQADTWVSLRTSAARSVLLGHVLRLGEEVWGHGVSELRRLRQHKEESRKLKQLVTDLSLYRIRLQDILRKKLQGRRSTNSSPATH